MGADIWSWLFVVSLEIFLIVSDDVATRGNLGNVVVAVGVSVSLVADDLSGLLIKPPVDLLLIMEGVETLVGVVLTAADAPSVIIDGRDFLFFTHMADESSDLSRLSTRPTDTSDFCCCFCVSLGLCGFSTANFRLPLSNILPGFKN